MTDLARKISRSVLVVLFAVAAVAAAPSAIANNSDACSRTIRTCQQRLGNLQAARQRAENAGSAAAVQQLTERIAEARSECAERVQNACD